MSSRDAITHLMKEKGEFRCPQGKSKGDTVGDTIKKRNRVKPWAAAEGEGEKK